MKIAFIGTEGIPGNYGGFETFVDNISYRLIQKGHEVTVFQPQDHQVDLDKTKHSKVGIIYVKCLKNKYFRAIIKRFDAYRKIKKGDFDVIHNFGSTPYLFKIFNKKAKTIVTIDGFEWKRESYNYFFKLYLKKNFSKTARFSNISIVDSQIVYDFFNKKGIKTHFLPYGIEFFEENEDILKRFKDLGLKSKNYIYFVGRFVREKNIHRLIEDFMQTRSNTKLVIIGKGNEGDLYEKYLIKIAELDKRIIFTGPIYGDEYKNIISHSKGYVSASLLEGTSPALLDALGAGIKVMVSNISENKATLNNFGKYYNLSDREISIKNLQSFLNDKLYKKEELKELLDFAYNTYEWNNIIEKYLKIIRDNSEIDYF